MSGIITLLVALLVFALMVVVHEFGHFAVAKLFKINVVEFAVGMGPAIFKKKKGATTYAVRCIPFGGYCMFDDDVGEADSPNSFANAVWYKRLCVVLAGAFLNLVLGFVVFALMLSFNATSYRPVITDFVANASIAQSELQFGDEILRLNDTEIHIKEDVDFFMQRNGAEPVLVTAKRGDEYVQTTVNPSLEKTVYTYTETEIEVVQYVNDIEFFRATEAAPQTEDYAEYIGKTGTSTRHIIGFYGTEPPRTLGTVLHDAFYNTIYNVKIVYISLFDLLRGNVTADQVSGPIGIVSVIGQATRLGLGTLLSLVGLLTVNLGIMNLLPIPGLDGCKAITTIIEAILRRRLPEKAEGYINLAGFALLILLMLWATFNDIQNLFIK